MSGKVKRPKYKGPRGQTWSKVTRSQIDPDPEAAARRAAFKALNADVAAWRAAHS